MKINSLYISSFGGIKNLKLNFNKGFNVIYGDNENGKSTVMAFIKMMFYGSERSSAQISKNIRKKYTPWDGSQMAGSIDFEHEGKQYRLEREFRSSNSTDKVTLCDLDLGTRQVVSADIGLKFFGLSSAAFERSVFIGQLGFPESNAEAEGEINSKLSNIVLTGDESVSFEAVYKRLEKAKLALMSKSGKAGEYDKNLKLYTELKESLEHSVEINNTLKIKVAEFEQREARILLLQKNAQAVKEKLDAEQDVRNATKLKKYLELKQSLDELNAQLTLDDGTLIDEMYLRKLQFCISKVESAAAKTKGKQTEIETLNKSLEIGLNPPQNATQDTADAIQKEIEAIEKENSELKEKAALLASEVDNKESASASKKMGVMQIAAIVLVVAGLAISFVSLIAGPIIALIGVGAFAFALISAKTRRKAQLCEFENKKAELEKIKSSISLKKQEIAAKTLSFETIKTALQSSEAVLEKQSRMLEEAKLQLEELKATQSVEEAALLQQFGKYKKVENTEEINSYLEEISAKAANQKEIKQQINFFAKDLGGISYEDAEEKLKAITQSEMNLEDDFDALKLHYEKLTAQILEEKSSLAADKAEAKAAISSAENPEIIQKKMKELDAKLKSQKEFCNAADISMQILAQSFAEIRRGYGSVLEKRAGEIFAGLTSGKYESVAVSKSLEINVTETGVFGGREIDYLSSGTADQAYLSLRLALAELIADGEGKLPMLLDDALTQYDDGRTKSALQYFKKYAEKGQIIMFTCHNSISVMAESFDADIINIKK